MREAEKTAELKPCPFCGGESISLETTPYGAWLECNGCHTFGTPGETAEDAIRAWNRRAEPPNPPLTLEELRQMDGEPVWVVAHPDWGHWEIMDEANVYNDREPDFYWLKHDDPCGKFGLHALGWLAYRQRKVED